MGGQAAHLEKVRAISVRGRMKVEGQPEFGAPGLDGNLDRTAREFGPRVKYGAGAFVGLLLVTGHGLVAVTNEVKPLVLLGDKDYPPIAYLENGVAKGL